MMPETFGQPMRNALDTRPPRTTVQPEKVELLDDEAKGDHGDALPTQAAFACCSLITVAARHKANTS
jgi:hypothetical protein